MVATLHNLQWFDIEAKLAVRNADIHKAQCCGACTSQSRYSLSRPHLRLQHYKQIISPYVQSQKVLWRALIGY